MIRVGLVSVTFRTLSPADIVRVAAQAELAGIEWAGDTHVPEGDIKTAKEVGDMTRAANLQVVSYGSYYRVGCSTTNPVSFDKVLDTAEALGAPNVRVFAGNMASRNARDHVWNSLFSDAQRCADLAKARNMTLAFEFQANTMNDTTESSATLHEKIARDNVYSYWQPDGRLLPADRLSGLKHMRDWLLHLHVFHWLDGRRWPLEEGEYDWERYITTVASTKRNHMALMEFVQDDLPANLIRDVNFLKGIINKLPN
ncbi:MAG: sugar phosphate isomerase/epimerase [Candidatus Hydrogenedentes bacterium]|nr:sugar phosphate isomerase/epimerase [Candidatus Hydrogenedentota bacterium]